MTVALCAPGGSTAGCLERRVSAARRLFTPAAAASITACQLGRTKHRPDTHAARLSCYTGIAHTHVTNPHTNFSSILLSHGLTKSRQKQEHFFLFIKPFSV